MKEMKNMNDRRSRQPLHNIKLITKESFENIIMTITNDRGMKVINAIK